ncbi:class D sortase [bacterium LRH843]|nr:class D sortase [bacterium LRH843]
MLSGSDLYKQHKNTENSLIEAKEKISLQSKQTPSLPPQKDGDIGVSFETGEAIGILEIPKLKAELPIIAGTNEDDLEKGVGHYTGTVLPGQPDQILLSGHRDTVFRRLGELENGDTFHIIMPYGEYTYEIINSQIVDALDPTIIKSTAPTETLTVSTCYPFSYIGSAPYRYVLHAHRKGS